MKKLLIFLLIICGISVFGISNGFANTSEITVNNVLSSNAGKMEYQRSTSAWYWNQFSWFDVVASIFKDTETKEEWVKIVHGNVRRGRVQPNPDYTGNFTDKLNKRKSKKFMAICDNGMTYYFD